MKRQTAVQAKESAPAKKSSFSWLRPAAAHPAAEAEHEAPSASSPAFAHDFTKVPVRPMQLPGVPGFSCPFAPQRCPSGGACHTCPPKLQAKLRIGQPGDRYEQEADRVAETVMRMPEPQVQRKGCSAPGCKEEDEDKKLVQTKSAGGGESRAHVDHPLIQSVLSSPGQPLDAGTRSFMEPRFGQDFSGVRVHLGGEAAESARAVNARAYTVGRDVVFGEGQYAPGSDEGKKLVAHELAHVTQQARHVDAVQPRMEVSCPEDSSEREADLASDAVAAGASFVVREAPSVRIVRKVTASASEVSTVPKQSAFNVFEVSSDATAAEALAAFDAYIKLSASDQERARSWSYSTGNLQKVLAALGPVNTVDPKYADAVHGILRWIKETQTHENTSKPDDKIVKPQANLIAAQTAWPDRGNISFSEQQTVDQQSADKKLAGNQPGSVITNQQADDYQHSPVDQKKQNSTDESAEESAAPAQAAPPVSAKSPVVKANSEGKVVAEAVEEAEGTPSEAPDPREAIAPATNAVRQRAAGARRHPSAATPVSSAQAAAKEPKTEQARIAATQTVENIDAAGKEAKDIERQRFKNTLTDAINKATPEPKTESDAERVMQQGAKEASQTLHGHLATERDTAAVPLKSAASTEVPPSAQPAQQQTDLQLEQVGTPPAAVAATPVVPKSLPPKRLDYSSDRAPTDQLMAENNISPEQLEEGNEPAFGTALEARSTAKENESTVEARYRQSESQVQKQAQGEAQQSVAQELTGFHGERKLRIGQVAGQQTATQSKDAAERQRVTDQIKTIKDNTRSDVNQILASMETDVAGVFDKGLKAAEEAYGAAFEEAKGGVGTWLTTWGDDWKSHIEASLKTARQKYLDVVGTAIDKVADLVGAKLAAARQRVADGRKEVEKFVAGLDGSVKQYGEEALKAVSADFDSMESEIDKRRDGLIDKLTQQYKESYERMSAKEEELRAENKSLWQRVYDATVGIVEKIIEFKNMLLGVLGRAADVIGDIIAHPIRFLGNLVDGVKLGLNNFKTNIGQHLQQALMGWLFGTMAEAGIQLPEQFDFKGILSLVLQVLGLTYANIRKRAVNLLGEKLVSRLEQVAEIFKILITEGPGGLWEYIKEKLGDLKAMVLDEIERFVTESIVVAGIKWIVSLLNPAAAFVKACMAIYDIIKFFIEKAAQVLALVNAVIESLAAIVAGNISGAAKFVEDALGKALPVVIGFLASLLGLGGISAKIRSIIEKIQQPVNTAIDWVINKAVTMVKAAGQLLGFGKEEPAAKEESPKTDDPKNDVDTSVNFGDESHTIRVHFNGERAIVLMASDEFGIIRHQLDVFSNTYMMPFREIGAYAVADDIAQHITAVKDIVGRGEKNISKRLEGVTDYFKRASIFKEEAHNTSMEVKDALDKLNKQVNVGKIGKAILGSAANLEVGDYVVIKNPERVMVIKEVKQLKEIGGKYEFVFKAESIDKKFTTFLLYIEEESKWKKSDKIPYEPFQPLGMVGGRVVINEDKLNSGSKPSYDPPFLGKTINGKKFEIRGHMVGVVFGGPGGKNNIVALTKRANEEMRSKVEVPLAKRIRKEKGCAYSYIATPQTETLQPAVEVKIVATKVYPSKQSDEVTVIKND